MNMLKLFFKEHKLKPAVGAARVVVPAEQQATIHVGITIYMSDTSVYASL